MAQQGDKEILHKHGYKLLCKIGQGAFSTVYKATNEHLKEPGEFAIKVIICNDRSLKESQVLKSLQHENIVKYIDGFHNTNFVFIVTEFCPEGDLENFIRQKHKLAEPLVKIIMQQLALAVHYIQSQKICHMDIKPKNILICKKPRLTFKLSDFGTAEILQLKDMEKWRGQGTVAYMAPEKLMGKNYDLSSDLWSLGVVMFQCIFGRPSYFEATLPKFKYLMQEETILQVPENSHISSSCEELLSRLLKYNPEERITLEDFYNHPFLDLINMPTTETFNRIIAIINEAIILDTEKTYDKSLKKYLEAITLLQPYLETETNSFQKEKLQFKLHEYMQRVKELQKLCTDKTVVQVPDYSFDTLKQMATSTPKLVTGLEIGTIGEEYLAEGKNLLAFNKISEALDVLMPLCSTEPAGYRKTLLLAQVQKWLKLAEELKKNV